MKNSTIFLFLFLLANSIYSQDALDYSKRLSHFKEITTIDGAEIDKEKRYANLKTNKMIFSDRSSVTFANCIIIVDGLLDASANCRIRLLNAYIICKRYKGPNADRIIITNNIENSLISDIPYIKNIIGNPILEIINKSGEVVAKGYKDSLSSEIIKTGVYDVRSKGNFYDTNVLLATADEKSI